MFAGEVMVGADGGVMDCVEKSYKYMAFMTPNQVVLPPAAVSTL